MTDLNYGTYQPDELMPLIPSMFVAGSFLQLLMFPGSFEFESAEVYFDRVLDDMRMAPYVAPLAPGQIQQPRGFRKETLIPASIKPKNQINAKEVLGRLAGEQLGGEMSAADRESALRQHYLTLHRERIARRHEWEAAQLLQTGSVVMVGDDYPTTTVDFSRSAALTKALTLTDRWGETGVSPYDDVEEWCDEVATTSGSAVNVVTMDRLAWNLYKADPKAQKALDRTLGQTTAMSLGLTNTTPGAPQYKGSDGSIEFYVYNDVYHDESFTTQQLVPDYSVGLISQGGYQGAKLSGLVQHAANHFAKGEFFPHEWVEDDTGAQFVETITSTILAPKRVNASAFATVR